MVIGQVCHCLGMNYSLSQVLELSLNADLDGNKIFVADFKGWQGSISVPSVGGAC